LAIKKDGIYLDCTFGRGGIVRYLESVRSKRTIACFRS